MNRRTAFLTNLRRIARASDLAMKPICAAYGLSPLESAVISFLHNNPGKDTAADIVELRMLSKGNVSQAVEGLIQKGLLSRHPDTADRRRIHLALLPASAPIMQAVEAANVAFEAKIFEGFSPEERRVFAALNDRFIENTKRAIEEEKS